MKGVIKSFSCQAVGCNHKNLGTIKSATCLRQLKMFAAQSESLWCWKCVWLCVKQSCAWPRKDTWNPWTSSRIADPTSTSLANMSQGAASRMITFHFYSEVGWIKFIFAILISTSVLYRARLSWIFIPSPEVARVIYVFRLFVSPSIRPWQNL